MENNPISFCDTVPKTILFHLFYANRSTQYAIS